MLYIQDARIWLIHWIKRKPKLLHKNVQIHVIVPENFMGSCAKLRAFVLNDSYSLGACNVINNLFFIFTVFSVCLKKQLSDMFWMCFIIQQNSVLLVCLWQTSPSENICQINIFQPNSVAGGRFCFFFSCSFFFYYCFCKWRATLQGIPFRYALTSSIWKLLL